MVTVSVIIPAHNTELYLEAAVHSALDQSVSDLEVLIVNDASTDLTDKVADDLAQRDNRVKVFHHAQNKLRSGALNTGIEHANGQYISILDSDDYYLQDKLERQIAFLTEHPEVDGVYGDFEILFEGADTTTPRTAIASTDQIHKRLVARANGETVDVMPEGYIPSCSALIRKNVFETIRFDESLRNMEDLDMWLQILGSGHTLVRLPGSTYVYRRHGEQKSRNAERMKIAREIIETKMQNGTYLK